ncbi:hypothetical protein EZS27_026467 [termite gut metagenome]|uniref:Uncharacterized protein n=1 Tax=termite gut metagenome TaxID=433724 RepID=A0A5J4QSS9_9ZZZZ
MKFAISMSGNNNSPLSIFHSPLSIQFGRSPAGSGYPLQSFLFVPSQKAFSLLSLTRHADFATNSITTSSSCCRYTEI